MSAHLSLGLAPVLLLALGAPAQAGDQSVEQVLAAMSGAADPEAVILPAGA